MPYKDKQVKTDYQRGYMRRRRRKVVGLLDPLVRPKPKAFAGPLTKERQVKGFNK